MRSDLTQQQSNILDSDVKHVSWLFEVDIGNTGSVDYYWSTKAKTWGGQSYTFKIMDFSPLKILKPAVEFNQMPPNEIDVKVSFKDSIQGAHRASDFEGASLTIRLICKAALGIQEQAGEIAFDTDTIDAELPQEEEAEILAWTFKIVSSKSVEQIMTWHCVDWFSEYIESSYPQTRHPADLFPGEIMGDDNYCVPVVLGTCYFPIRWVTKWLTVTYSDADTFTISGDYTSLFAAGYWLYADCGADGYKDCWVDSSSESGGTTTVNLTAGSDNLTSNLTQVFIDFYVLGPDTPTYTIDRLRTPQEIGGDAEYLSTSYTFKQDTIAGADGNDYKIVRAIIDDLNDDGTYDANGIWGLKNTAAHDVPFKFYRSDTSSITNPANQAEYLMEDLGAPSGKINATAQTTAAAVYTSRGFSLNIPLWQKQPSKNVLCKLFTVSGMVPIIRDDIYLKVLTKTSQLAIEKDLVIEGTFKVTPPPHTEKLKDSGYVLWQKSTVPVGQGVCNKNLIAAKSSTSNPSDTTIECEWVSDDTGVKAQKAGILALQKKLLRDKKISFKAKAKILKLEPGDVITINQDDHGAEGSGYDVTIESMAINRDLTVSIEAIQYRETMDDWDDLSASTITIGTSTTASACSPVYQGPRGATPDSGSKPNEITENVYIASTGILATNEDVATNGGFKATNTQMFGYDSDGNLHYQVDYGGINEGDFFVGSIADNRYLQYDHSAGTWKFVTDNAGGVEIKGGGDATLRGSDTDPGVVKWVGTSYSVEAGCDVDGDRFSIIPDTTNAIDFYLGDYSYWWSDKLFKTINTHSYGNSAFQSGAKPLGTAGSSAGISIQGSSEQVRITVQESAVGVKASNYDFTKEGVSLGTYLQGTLKIYSYQDDSLADDGTVNLPDATSGIVFVSCNGEAGMWLVQNDGSVTKISGSANTAATDSDTDLCVYDGGGTTAIVKNRLGAVGEIRIFYFYN